MTKVQYFRHWVGGGILRFETGKVKAIMAWPTPQTKKQIMSFLVITGYYWTFLLNSSALAKPLTDLTNRKLPILVS